MVQENILFDQIKALLYSEHFAVLATRGSEYPYCSLVGYAPTADGTEVLFATNRQTRKYGNITKTPKVSLLIDSETNQENDLRDAKALTILGSAREIDTETNPDYLALYIKKHPALKDFVAAPDCALMRVTVEKYILVTNFQDVQEYRV